MRKFIFTLILLLAGYIGYMYFFGKGEDKAKAKTIVVETRNLANDITDFLTHQQVHYDEKEFDQLIQKVQVAVDSLKSTTKQEQDPSWNKLRDIQIELLKLDPRKLNRENQIKLDKTLNELYQILKS